MVASKDKVVASPLSKSKVSSSSLNTQKMTLSPTRRSERLEKRTPETITDLDERESESLNPTKRSERGESMSSLSPIGSIKLKSRFNPDLSNSKRKGERKEKSLSQLTKDIRERNTKEHNNGNERVTQHDGVVKKLLHARDYKSLFTRQTKKKLFVQDQDQVLETSDRFYEKYDNTPCTTCSSKQVDQEYESNERTEQGPEHNEENCKGPTRECLNMVDEPSSIAKTDTEDSLRRCANMELPPLSPKYIIDMHVTETREVTHDTMSSVSHLPNGGTVSNATDEVLTEKSNTLQPPEQLEIMSEKNLSRISNDLERSEKNSSLRFKKSPLDLGLTSAVNATTSQLSDHSVDSYSRLCSGCSKKRSSHNLAEEACCCSVESGQNLVEKENGELEAEISLEDANKCRSGRKAQELPLDVHEDDCNTCFNCKLGGDLLCCDGKGCKRSYHLYCLDPPLTDFPLGAWYCIGCVVKKIKFGVHVVSKGIEFICDAREVEIMENKETRKQKQYFVKYRSLANAHNRWIPETELLQEASSLVSDFMQTSQITKWKQEWSVPQRLLQKRQLISPKQLDKYCEENDGNCLDCQYEWLVKWCGLNYDQVTWELEDSRFLNTPEAQRLKFAYESRHMANNDSPGVKRMGSLVKLSEFPAGTSLKSADKYLDSVNKLHEFWDKGQNSVLIDDSCRTLKVILFIVSLESSISRPVLIIAPSDELLIWEREFLQLAPSINVVVYNGNKDIRQRIRAIETFDEQIKAMFQVLITTEEIMSEDLEVLVHLGWEMIIIDRCQQFNAGLHFGHIKRLITDIRLLLVSGRLKETAAEYCNMLSLLDFRDGSADRDYSNHDVVFLKNKISKYMVQECKLDNLRFVEYWIPAQASNVQIEQYCAALISSALSLCSSSKKDTVEALHEIIISNRKSCDHPLLVDPSVHLIMSKGIPDTEYLDVGIKASGKLQLLDLMLSEVNKRDLRVLILFQSISGVRKDSVNIGDILDDYMRLRFGADSYERIDVLHPKKQAALDKFNNKENGRFVLLLEARASSTTIKLESIDAVIIYGSDWIPTHDFKNLQKISFQSHYDQIKVFRLYSSYTLEENVLIHVKQSMTPDPHNKFRNTNHKLLMWGTIHLFERLEKFHASNERGLDSSEPSHKSLLTDVLMEFSTILDGCNSTGNCSVISTVKHNGSRYISDNLLLGETEKESSYAPPHLFWTRLLEGKNPRWIYVSGSSQRNRKRVHHMNDQAKKSDVEIAGVSKKRKKVVDQGYVKFQQDVAKTCHGNREGSANMHHVHKRFHSTLQSEVVKLCKALQLSDDIKGMVDMFLAYVMTNHHVPDKPATIIQAFQIAFCWTVASFLKKRIDQKISLAHAKKHLGYKCTEEEAERVYSKLQCLKSIFLYHSGYLKLADSSTLANKDVSENIAERLPLPVSCEEQMSEVLIRPADKTNSGKQSFSQKHCRSVVKMVKKDVSRSLKKIEKKCNKKILKLLRKQEGERKELLEQCEEDKEMLNKSQKLDAAVIRFSLESNLALREDKLKSLDDEYKKRYEEHEKQREKRLRYLGESQQAARKKEEQKAKSWIEELNSWAQIELLDKLCPDGSCKLASDCDIGNQTRPGLIEFVEDVNESQTIPEADTLAYEVRQHSAGIFEARPSDSNGNLCRKLAEAASANSIDQCHRTGALVRNIEHNHGQAWESTAVRPSNGPENLNDVGLTSNELNCIPYAMPQDPDDIVTESSTYSQPEDNPISKDPHSVQEHGGSGLPVISISGDSLVDVPVNWPSSEICNSSRTSPNVAARLCLAGIPTAIGPSDCFDSALPVNLPQTVASNRSGEYISSSTTLCQPDGNATSMEVAGQRSFSNDNGHSGECEQSQSQPSLNTNPRIPISVYSGPLQNELERIRKEIDCNNKLQHDKRMQLESDCEKEIAEAVAQIRGKYKIKYQEIEEEYDTKSKELKKNQDKVLMNKTLAEAFYSKCMDVRSPTSVRQGKCMDVRSPSSVRQDRSSNFRQQLAFVSSQHTSQGTSSATVPSAGHPTLGSRSTAVYHLQHTTPAAVIPMPPTLLGSQHPSQGPPSVSVPSTGLPTLSSRNTALSPLQHRTPPVVSPMYPTVQGIRHSSAAPSLSIPPRPAETNYLSNPKNTQLGSEIRTMPPHLQRNRSSMSMPTSRAPLHLHGSSKAHSPNTFTAPVLLQRPSHSPAQTSSAVTYNGPQRPEIAEKSPAIPNSSTAVPLDHSPVVNSSKILPPLVHVASDLVAQQPSTQNRMQGNLANTIEADIVCLSDDE